MGGAALGFALLWMLVVVLSLVDIESHRQLFMSVPILDQSYRVNWTEKRLAHRDLLLRTLFLLVQTLCADAQLLFLVCAARRRSEDGQYTSVSSRGDWQLCLGGIRVGSAEWHLPEAFSRSRFPVAPPVPLSIGLRTVTGLDLCVILWNAIYAGNVVSLSSNPEDWSLQSLIISWLDTLLWSPNHVASLSSCCFFAFLLAWMGRKERPGFSIASVIFIGLSLASAFGLSIYVTFAFFLVMIVWAIWQVAVEKSGRPVILLAAGGVAAAVLLIPFLRELMHGSTGTAGGGSPFEFSVREMIPANVVTATSLFQHFAPGLGAFADTFARLLLLVPGYALELGFYLAVLLIYMFVSRRGRQRLTRAERSLVFIVMVTIPLTSFLRSSVISINDFGMRSALLLQFPLLILGSGLITAWKTATKRGLSRKA